MRFGVLMTVATGVALAAASGALAQFSPKDAVAVRISGYRETGAAFKTLNDELKSDAPAKIMLKISAKRIVQTAHEQYGWFPAGSGPEAGVKTKAKPVIWTDAAGFKLAQDRLQTQADLMAKAVEAGDQAVMKTQAHDLGAACAACHNKYRAED